MLLRRNIKKKFIFVWIFVASTELPERFSGTPNGLFWWIDSLNRLRNKDLFVHKIYSFLWQSARFRNTGKLITFVFFELFSSFFPPRRYSLEAEARYSLETEAHCLSTFPFLFQTSGTLNCVNVAKGLAVLKCF